MLIFHRQRLLGLRCTFMYRLYLFFEIIYLKASGCSTYITTKTVVNVVKVKWKKKKRKVYYYIKPRLAALTNGFLCCIISSLTLTVKTCRLVVAADLAYFCWGQQTWWPLFHKGSSVFWILWCHRQNIFCFHIFELW